MIKRKIDRDKDVDNKIEREIYIDKISNQYSISKASIIPLRYPTPKRVPFMP